MKLFTTAIGAAKTSTVSINAILPCNRSIDVAASFPCFFIFACFFALFLQTEFDERTWPAVLNSTPLRNFKTISRYAYRQDTPLRGHEMSHIETGENKKKKSRNRHERLLAMVRKIKPDEDRDFRLRPANLISTQPEAHGTPGLLCTYSFHNFL